MHDAQLRFAIQEDALSSFCSLEHCRCIVGKVRFDDERREISGGCLWLEATGVDGFFQCPVDR